MGAASPAWRGYARAMPYRMGALAPAALRSRALAIVGGPVTHNTEFIRLQGLCEDAADRSPPGEPKRLTSVMGVLVTCAALPGQRNAHQEEEHVGLSPLAPCTPGQGSSWRAIDKGFPFGHRQLGGEGRWTAMI
jgi:hypothetical protein